MEPSTSPSPTSDNREKAARQRRSQTAVLILLVTAAVLVILIAPEPEGPGSKLGALLSFVTLGLTILIAFVVPQWAWRPRFVLHRGGPLGVLWIVAVLIWYATSFGNNAIFIAELVLIGVVVGMALILWRRQKTTVQRDSTPEELEQALAQHRATAEKNREANPTAAAGADYNSALIEQQRGNLDEARRALEKALVVYDNTGSALMQAHCLNVLGQIAENPHQALAYYEQALTLLRQEVKGHIRLQSILGLDSLEGNEVMFLNNIGNAHLRLEQPAQAVPPLEEALALHRRHGEPQAILSSLLLNLGMAHARLGHVETARTLSAEAEAEINAGRSLRPAETKFLRDKLDELLSLLATSTGNSP